MSADARTPVVVVARHIVLSPEHLRALFGDGHQLVPVIALGRPHESVCLEQVTLRAGSDGARVALRVVKSADAVETRIELSEKDLILLRPDGDKLQSVLVDGPCGTIVLGGHHVHPLRHLRVPSSHPLAGTDSTRVEIISDRGMLERELPVRIMAGLLTPEIRLGQNDFGRSANTSPRFGRVNVDR